MGSKLAMSPMAAACPSGLQLRDGFSGGTHRVDAMIIMLPEKIVLLREERVSKGRVGHDVVDVDLVELGPHQTAAFSESEKRCGDRRPGTHKADIVRSIVHDSVGMEVQETAHNGSSDLRGLTLAHGQPGKTAKANIRACVKAHAQTHTFVQRQLVEPLLHVHHDRPRVPAHVVANLGARNDRERPEGRAAEGRVDGLGPLDRPTALLGELNDEKQRNRTERPLPRVEFADDAHLEHALNVAAKHAVTSEAPVERYHHVAMGVGEPAQTLGKLPDGRRANGGEPDEGLQVDRADVLLMQRKRLRVGTVGAVNLQRGGTEFA